MANDRGREHRPKIKETRQIIMAKSEQATAPASEQAAGQASEQASEQASAQASGFSPTSNVETVQEPRAGRAFPTHEEIVQELYAKTPAQIIEIVGSLHNSRLRALRELEQIAEYGQLAMSVLSKKESELPSGETLSSIAGAADPPLLWPVSLG
jgi:hypothetical protein